jgi:hypothetical protein
VIAPSRVALPARLILMYNQNPPSLLNQHSRPNLYSFLTALIVAGTLAVVQKAEAGQAPVFLGSAAKFGVLAGSTVTSTGGSTVNGDLGVWSGSAVTGFAGIVPGGPGTVNGTIHAGDSVAQIAQGDLTTAFNDAAGRTLAPVSMPNADLGGLTLAPGLYKSTGTMALTGNVTLDGQGDPNAVFIFQITSSLNAAPGSQVILINGARAANVFWQVGTSATFATTVSFRGTIMADQSISFGTGSTLEGRALARIAGISFQSNTVTVPSSLAQPVFGRSQYVPNGSMTLVITNTPGVTLVLQRSINLTNWFTVMTVVPGSSPASLVDTSAAGQAKRFYRAYYQ